MPTTRRSKRGASPADTPVESNKKVKKTKKTAKLKKTEKSSLAKDENIDDPYADVIPAGTNIENNRKLWRTSPSAQSVSSLLNRDKVLDLDVSYVGTIEPEEKPPKPPRHPRWKHKGKKPLEDLSQAPDDWTESEPDLSEDDYDGQIQRCEERIEDNIMVTRFKDKLENLKSLKASRDFLIDSEPHGLSWDVIQRLNSLKSTEQILSQKDPYNQLKTVRAIMRAYRQHNLEWNDGLVTYWVEDRQLCQPRPFDWDELDQIKEKNAKNTSIWIEGATTPKPVPMAAATVLEPDAVNMHTVRYTFRIPGTRTTSSLDVMEDTGASYLTLYEADIKNLIRPAVQFITEDLVMGRMRGVTSNGFLDLPVIKLEVCLTINGISLIPWTPVQCCVFEGRYTGQNSSRLAGPILRSGLFTGTAPDNRGRLFLADSRPGLLSILPNPDIRLAHMPNIPLGRHTKGQPVF